MKIYLRYFIVVIILQLSSVVGAQSQVSNDSMVHVHGLVVSADSLKGVPYSSIVIKGTSRGTISDENGVFNIEVPKGVELEITSIGYEGEVIGIPVNIQLSEYAIVQVMIRSAEYLPGISVKPKISREQFDREFLNLSVSDSAYILANRNMDPKSMQQISVYLPLDGGEGAGTNLRQNAAKSYAVGQVQQQNIFNLVSWKKFFQSPHK